MSGMGLGRVKTQERVERADEQPIRSSVRNVAWNMSSAGTVRTLPVVVAVVAVALVVGGTGGLGVVMSALAQSSTLTKADAPAGGAYDKALREFKAILA